MAGERHVRQAPPGRSLAKSQLDRLLDGLLRALEVGEIPARARLLDVGIAQPMVGAGLARLAPNAPQRELDRIVGIQRREPCLTGVRLRRLSRRRPCCETHEQGNHRAERQDPVCSHVSTSNLAPQRPRIIESRIGFG
jgi:hypothetical protein